LSLWKVDILGFSRQRLWSVAARQHRIERDLGFGGLLLFPKKKQSLEEEEKLLQNAAPYLQDLIVFALNTGIELRKSFRFAGKTWIWRKTLWMSLRLKRKNFTAFQLTRMREKFWSIGALGKRNEFVFYNPETGKPFVDLKAGFKLACKKAGIAGVTWRTLRHTFASRLVDRGVDMCYRERIVGTFQHHGDDALHAHESWIEASGGREATHHWVWQNCDSMHDLAATKERTVTKSGPKLQCSKTLVPERWPRGWRRRFAKPL
jgi:hypothetical protein